jgi:hypothetical protein
MPLNINREFCFSYNPSYVRKQLIYLFIWSCAGLFLIYLTPHFFVSYIVPVLGFSLFIYLLWEFKQPYLIINNYKLSYGTIYKTVIDLRTVRRIKNFGKDYIIKTENRNYTLRSYCLEESEYPLLHEFLIQYTNAQQIIFP